MTRATILLTFALGLWPSGCLGGLLLEEAGEFGAASASEPHRFEFEAQESGKSLLLTSSIKLTQGKLVLRITGPDGKVVLELGASSADLSQPLNAASGMGKYVLEVVPESAIGKWSVRITTEVAELTAADVGRLAGLAGSGIGMIVVGTGAVILWRLRSAAKWRWFWVGAAVWAVGVALKFAWAIPLNGAILEAIKVSLPHGAYLTLGSIYIGLLTGVFEIGVTLGAALIWKKLSQDYERGVAIGVGAGAIEAVLLGALVLPAVIAATVLAGPARDQVLSAVAVLEQTTPLFWLVAPVERIIAILCHTSSRALVLLGVARGRWFWPFLGGFTLMTLVDSVAGYVHLAGLTGTLNMWLVELAILPAALSSIPIIIWCVRNWPSHREPLTAETAQA